MSNPAYRWPSKGLFWSLAFVYASCMALLMQKVVLPLIPEMHAGHGLLPNDAIVFHNIAVEMAGKIHAEGWGAWTLFPGAAGNVGVLSAVYALFGPDPAWFIPLNAMAHATGALLVYRIGGRLWPGDTGALGGLMAGIAFLVFPSALQWYGQNHKDAFAIVGTLLVLDAWIDLHAERELTKVTVLQRALQVAVGISLLGIVRPYFPIVLVGALLLSCLAATVFSMFRRLPDIASSLLFRLLIIGMAACIAVACARIEIAAGVYGEGDTPLNLQLQSSDDAVVEWVWRPTEGFPLVADKMLKRASELRAHFVAFGRSVDAGSEIDGEYLPNSAMSAILYTPRALIVGLLAPFPDMWTERVSVPRLIGAVETAIWYLFALGIAVLLWQRFSPQLLAGVIFCATLLTVLAYIHPNVGTLYRQRFGVWQFFLLCGALGWASILLPWLRGGGSRHRGIATRGVSGHTSQMDKLAASGAVVVLITLACYLGFLARDLLLVKELGMGSNLDAFFTALMVPMFFVTCLAMPIADAMTLPFLAIGEKGQGAQREEYVRRLLGLATLVLGVAAALVTLVAPYVVIIVLGEKNPEALVPATEMLRWFVPIIVLSAWTVIGNAALNALRCSRDAALGQLVVPCATIAALLLWSGNIAPFTAIAGMLFGTLLNAAWVYLRLRHHGIRLLPANPFAELLRPTATSYRRLFLAASLTAALVPLNYAFAASVVSGGVSAWALANKIVVLFTGLANVGASAVVLPYFARTISRGLRIREDTCFLLVAGSSTGGLLTVGALLFADPLVAAALADSLKVEQLSDLSGIVKIGVLQLPIAIAGAVVAKVAIVSGVSSRVLIAAALGFVCNLLVNLFLVPSLGVLGVAIGALAATAGSTLALIFAVRVKIGLTLREIAMLLASWVVWVGVGMVVAGGL